MSSPELVDQPAAPVRRRYPVGEIVFAVLGWLAVAHIIVRIIRFLAGLIMHAVHPHHHHGHHRFAGAGGHPAVAHAHHLAHHHHLLVALIVSLILAIIFFAISALLRRRRERAESGGAAVNRVGGGGPFGRLRGRPGRGGHGAGR